MSLIIDSLISAVSLGGIYALIALGYSMVYGTLGFINFAHGELLMIGGYSLYFTMLIGLHPIIAIGFAIFIPLVFSFTIEKLAYKPFRNKSPKMILITAVGISTLLQSLAQLIFGASGKPISREKIIPSVQIDIFGKNISLISILTIIISVALMLLLSFVVKKTKVGRAIRASSEDVQTAKLMGINPNKIISLVFALGSALAGIGSVFYLMRYPTINPTVGFMPGMKAFIAAVLGGIGIIPGAMLGGFIIGFIEVFTTVLGFSQWTDSIVFLMLICVLLIRPSGLLGKKIQEKV